MTGPSAAFGAGSLWVVDLDGVIWLSGAPIGDPSEAVASLRTRGARVVFATNNSAPTMAELLARLSRIGIEATEADLVSSAAVAASLLAPGQTVRILGEAGLVEALAARAVGVVAAGPCDAAVVGWSRTFDFESLAATADAARASGRLIATNEDPTHPTPDGLVPGAGALLAAVATASGCTPEIAGKPHSAMVGFLQSRFGFAAGDPGVVLVGDQPRTDGRLAERLAVPFALVETGVYTPGTPLDGCPVAVHAPDFATLVRESSAG
jgi:HAD superfamily hydrolase (TIGR01450 family)